MPHLLWLSKLGRSALLHKTHSFPRPAPPRDQYFASLSTRLAWQTPSPFTAALNFTHKVGAAAVKRGSNALVRAACIIDAKLAELNWSKSYASAWNVSARVLSVSAFARGRALFTLLTHS